MASGDPRNTSRENSESSESPSSPLKKVPAKTGKAGSSKKMTDKEQSERFIETARELGADENGDAFVNALNSIIRPRPK